MDRIQEFKKFIFEDYNIINPILTFDGDYIYGDGSFRENNYDPNHDILVINAKTSKDGNNAYVSLIDKRLLFNLHDPRFYGMLNRCFQPVLVNKMNEDGKGRHIEFSLLKTIFNLMEDKSRIIGDKFVSEYQCASNCIDYYKGVRNQIKDVLKNGDKAESYNDVKFRFDSLGKELNETTLRVYLLTLRDIIFIYTCIQDLTVKPIIVSESDFKNCFDEDRLLLLYCKCIIDNQRYRVKQSDMLDSSFVLVNQVMTTMREYGIHNLNTKIKVYDKQKRKVVDYTYKDLKKEYNYYYEKYYPMYRPSSISFDQVEKMGATRDNKAFEKLVDILSDEEQKIINTEFDILAKGEGTSNGGYHQLNSNRSSERKVIDDDEILYRKFIFEQTEYAAQIVGKDKFNGYVGFIYENGLVVFERFYEDDGKPSSQNATYIMNYKNFINFIQLTKPEIIEYIKSTDNPDIKRLYHTKNWADNLGNNISAHEANMETQVFAHTITTDVVKKKVRSDN